MTTPGRNDPCPCGSGRKYKNCHLALDERFVRGSQAIHQMDNDLTARVDEFASELLGDGYLGFDRWNCDQAELHYLITFTHYHIHLDGRNLVRWFLEAEGESLETREREWLEAQSRSWLSVWDVESIDPGRGVGVRDLLTGERRDVIEIEGSKRMVLNHTIVARVVDFEESSYLCGLHPYPLRPLDAKFAVDEIRRRLRVKRRVTPSRLLTPRAAEIVTDCWDDVVDAVFERARRGPTLQNTEGDALLFVTDRFTFKAPDREAVANAIRSLPGVEEDAQTFVVIRDRTVIANISLGKASLKIETNSVRRADSARKLLESACGSLVAFTIRDLVDPTSAAVREAATSAGGLMQSPTEEMLAIARQQKEEHYSTWPDEPLPILRGRTPRQAARTKEGREHVEALLRDFEHFEEHEPPTARFDVALLRRELGLK